MDISASLLLWKDGIDGTETGPGLWHHTTKIECTYKQCERQGGDDGCLKSFVLHKTKYWTHDMVCPSYVKNNFKICKQVPFAKVLDK